MPIQVTDNTGSPKQGKKIDSATMPTGGKGVIGWLSAIWYKLTQGITVSGTVTATTGGLTDAELRASAVPVSLASVPSHAVTNDGTFATQIDGTALTSLQLIDDIVHSLNATLDKVAAIGAQLDDTSTTSATEDKIAPLRMTAKRALHTNLRKDDGTEIGTSSNPVYTTQGTSSTTYPGDDRTATVTLSGSGASEVEINTSDCAIVSIKIENTSATRTITAASAIESGNYASGPLYIYSDNKLPRLNLTFTSDSTTTYWYILCAGTVGVKLSLASTGSGTTEVHLRATKRIGNLPPIRPTSYFEGTTITANNQGIYYDCYGQKSILLTTITIGFRGYLRFYYSHDGSSIVDEAYGFHLLTKTKIIEYYWNTDTGYDFFIIPCAGFNYIRVQSAGVAAGNCQIRLQSSSYSLIDHCVITEKIDLNDTLNTPVDSLTFSEDLSSVNSVPYLYNGTNFDFPRSNTTGIAFASASRTVDTNIDIYNHNARGIIVTLDVTAITATPSITLRIRSKDPASGKYENLNAAPTAVTGVGTHTYILYPGADITEVGDSVQTTSVPLPRVFNIFIDHADGDSITYSVGYQLIL